MYTPKRRSLTSNKPSTLSSVMTFYSENTITAWNVPAKLLFVSTSFLGGELHACGESNKSRDAINNSWPSV
jgi:hypothetical protein